MDAAGVTATDLRYNRKRYLKAAKAKRVVLIENRRQSAKFLVDQVFRRLAAVLDENDALCLGGLQIALQVVAQICGGHPRDIHRWFWHARAPNVHLTLINVHVQFANVNLPAALYEPRRAATQGRSRPGESR